MFSFNCNWDNIATARVQESKKCNHICAAITFQMYQMYTQVKRLELFTTLYGLPPVIGTNLMRLFLEILKGVTTLIIML